MDDLREGSTFHRKSTEFLRRKVGRFDFEIRFFFRHKNFVVFYKGSPVLYLGKHIASDAEKKIRDYFRDIQSGKTRKIVNRLLSVNREKQEEEIIEKMVLIPLHDDRHSDERFLRNPVSNIDKGKWHKK